MSERSHDNWVERKGTRFMVERELSRSRFLKLVVEPSDMVMEENGITFYLLNGKTLGFLPNSRELRYILVVDPRPATKVDSPQLPESKVKWY